MTLDLFIMRIKVVVFGILCLHLERINKCQTVGEVIAANREGHDPKLHKLLSTHIFPYQGLLF